MTTILLLAVLGGLLGQVPNASTPWDGLPTDPEMEALLREAVAVTHLSAKGEDSNELRRVPRSRTKSGRRDAGRERRDPDHYYSDGTKRLNGRDGEDGYAGGSVDLRAHLYRGWLILVGSCGSETGIWKWRAPTDHDWANFSQAKKHEYYFTIDASGGAGADGENGNKAKGNQIGWLYTEWFYGDGGDGGYGGDGGFIRIEYDNPKILKCLETSVNGGRGGDAGRGAGYNEGKSGNPGRRGRNGDVELVRLRN